MNALNSVLLPSRRCPRAAAALVAAGLCLALASPAAAKIDPERISDDLTNWYYLSNVTEAQIVNLINAEDARLIDIEVFDTAPITFTAAFVRNTGTYASGWWWYYGLTAAEVAVHLDANNARLIDIERYIDDGLERFAVIMVPNVGPQAKAWWWYYGITPTEISGYLDANNGRLTDIESYDTGAGRRYAVIMLENTGEDAAGWAWYYNTDVTTVQAYMEQNNMRLLEFEMRNPATPTMDAILISNSYQTPQTWWWYYGVAFDQIDDLAAQAGSRVVDIDRYDAGGGTFRYNLVLLNDATSLTVDVAQILDWGNNGDTGCYLREIGGPTYASLQPDFGFEPASSIKIAHHLHAMRQVMAGNISLATPVNYSINYSSSCPLGGAPTTTQTLRETLRRMMVNSDNAATKGIADLYGFNAITATAQTAGGMTSSSVNHELGCGAAALADPNVLTLSDAGRLFERVETAVALSPAMRDTFYTLMQNQGTVGPWWFTTDLRGTVDDVAVGLGLGNFADSYWTSDK
ncbi:MAG: serine hydrolase [Candidatus Krumholzibacteriia bacterium]